ncbi:MAG TPA: radical SAM protein [Pseudonocardiaceae bacterium]|jgi:MoaA/NifB/PqqE/SkfB family radical SAM enzyme|nr:radical SAM protein [Pseudonocardiaceae bacterium]
MTNSSVVRSPTFLWLEVTGRCQLECVHCYADSGPTGTHGTMSVADWTRIIDEAADLGVRTVQFIGGEPTLYPALPELINHALGRLLAVEVYTNLVHVTSAMWAVFEQPGLSLATSYYSDDPARHAAITGRPSHARTRANIAEAVRRGIPLRVGTVDLGDDQRTEQARADLVELGVPTVGYDRVRQFGRGAAGEQSSADQLCGRCGDGAAAIGPDGAARPCVMSRWVSLGNVRHDSLAEVVAALPAARQTLTSQGMRAGTDTCGPNCSPISTGTECFPHNCHPR